MRIESLSWARRPRSGPRFELSAQLFNEYNPFDNPPCVRHRTGRRTKRKTPGPESDNVRAGLDRLCPAVTPTLCREPIYATRVEMPFDRMSWTHSSGPERCTDSPRESTATVTGMSFTSNS